MKKTVLLVSVLVLLLIVHVAEADYIFGEPTNLGPTINSSFDEGSLTMTQNGLELYFDSGRKGWSLWVTRRSTVSDPWVEPEMLWFTPGNTIDFGPCLSADGLELYYSSNRDGAFNILIARRATLTDPWQEPVNIGPAVSNPQGDLGPSISADGLELFFGSDRSGGLGPADIWVTKRESKDDYDSWSKPVNLGDAVNSPFVDNSPFISPDGLSLFFESNRPGGYGDFDIWVSKRETINDEWGQAVNLGPPINSELAEYLPGISPNGRRFYFAIVGAEGGLGGYDIWQSPIEQIVDLNVDGIVDAADMCIIVDNWGTDSSLCDIGPRPFGDGVVDVQDLIVLSEHLFEQVNDATLVAHWTLDETEGMFAADSVGANAAFVVGGATWQPGGGQVGGALQFDGVSGCAIAGPVLNPADCPFSILAWVKGGGSNQVIISHQNMADWLATDSNGNLMTELKSTDLLAGPLLSETNITDGQWHRIVLAWDGLHRKLYVDGVKVAEDAQDGLESFDSGLYIGVGNSYTAGTYFSGMIDDIRVYNREVIP